MFDLIEEAGGSLTDFIQMIGDAWHGFWEKISTGEYWAWVADVFDGYVIIKKGESGSYECKYYRVPYTIADGEVSFAPKMEWEEVMLDYVPVMMMDDDTEETSTMESLRGLVESAENGLSEAVVLVEGLSANGNYYTKEALQSGISVFSGAKMYVDHPTRSEESDRPERSVRDLVGKLGEAYVGKDKAGNTALRAPIVFSETAGWLKKLVQEGIADGLSIRAYGKGKRDTKAGHFVVEAFNASPHTSVDFVTVPAAGGYAELSESARQGFWEEITQDEIQKHRPDLIEEAEAVLLEEGTLNQEELKKLQEAHDALLEENKRLVKQIREAEASTVLAEALVDLPDVVRGRVEGFAQPVIEAYCLDSEQTAEELQEALASLVKAEKDYLAKVTPNGVVSGIHQESTVVDDEAVDQALEEAFSGILGDKDATQIAIKGR